jgi:hypothetical protein
MGQFLTFQISLLYEQVAPKVETGKRLKIKAMLQSILDALYHQPKQGLWFGGNTFTKDTSPSMAIIQRCT